MRASLLVILLAAPLAGCLDLDPSYPFAPVELWIGRLEVMGEGPDVHVWIRVFNNGTEPAWTVDATRPSTFYQEPGAYTRDRITRIMVGENELEDMFPPDNVLPPGYAVERRIEIEFDPMTSFPDASEVPQYGFHVTLDYETPGTRWNESRRCQFTPEQQGLRPCGSGMASESMDISFTSPPDDAPIIGSPWDPFG